MLASEFGGWLVEKLSKRLEAKLFGEYIDLKIEEDKKIGVIIYTYFYKNDTPENFFFKLECIEEKYRCSFWKDKSQLEICVGNNGCSVKEMKDKSLDRNIFSAWNDIVDIVYNKIISEVTL